jgi:cytochrome d ubiquinol oxidase subunit II
MPASVAAIIASWALPQSPLFLPGLTIEAAAAPCTTLIAVTVAVLGGAVILFPSPHCCCFGSTSAAVSPKAAKASRSAGRPGSSRASRQGLLGRAALALACFIAGIGLLTAAEAGWARALAVVSLFGFVALGFPAALPPTVGPHTDETKR